MAKPLVYTVRACRWGDKESHSYIVGVYSKKAAALKAAQTERDYRGGKYECEVIEWTLDSGCAGTTSHMGKTILELPGNTLRGSHNSPAARTEG